MFQTAEFAIFTLICFASVWLLKDRPRIRIALLLFFSGYFFVRTNLAHPFRDLYPETYTAPRVIFITLTLFVFSSTLDFFVGKTLGRQWRKRRRKHLVILSVVTNLTILGVFKYFDFFASELSSLLNIEHKVGVRLLFPIGISFYTFQSLSYIFDVYHNRIWPTERYTHYLLYLAFFPQLIMGPIVRANVLLPQLEATPQLTADKGAQAMARIGIGVIKKLAIADFLRAQIVDPVFGNPDMFSSAETLTAVYAYSFQIWADFSGYTDIAIGIALLLGISLPENFNAPYKAESLREFWQRWHMTLSTWLRDYLYIPLGGSRGSHSRTYINLMITMVLGGLWHGASMNFLIWGTIHGAALAVTRVVSKRGLVRRIPERVQAIAGPLLTFHIVTAAWVFFRAPTFKGALDIFRGLFTFEFGAANITAGALTVIGLAAATHLMPKAVIEKTNRGFHALPAPIQAVLFVAAVYAADRIGAVKVSAFIYSQF